MCKTEKVFKNCKESKNVVFAKELPDGSIQVSKDINHFDIMTVFPFNCKMKPTFKNSICIIKNFEYFVQW